MRQQPVGSHHLLKVLLLGDGSVGKTSLLKRYVCNEFDPASMHTFGVEFLNKEVHRDNQVYTLQIWDTAGQERFRTLRTPFYRGTEICLLVFALNKADSFAHLSLWRDEFMKYTDLQDPLSFPFVVVGNKCDLEERAVSSDEALAWCLANGNIPYFEASAKTAVKVEDAFLSGIARWLELDSNINAAIGSPHLSKASSFRVGAVNAGETDSSRKASCCSR